MSTIDRSSHLPYYEQLVELLRHEIVAQQARNEVFQLPSENELAERYGLSRATVRHALDELERDGWIFRQKGVGSFAPARRFEQDLTLLVSTTEDMRQRGWSLVTRVISLAQEPAHVHVSYWASRRTISACIKMSIRCPARLLPLGGRTIRPPRQGE